VFLWDLLQRFCKADSHCVFPERRKLLLPGTPFLHVMADWL
jgi:hypothetical protein